VEQQCLSFDGLARKLAKFVDSKHLKAIGMTVHVCTKARRMKKFFERRLTGVA